MCCKYIFHKNTNDFGMEYGMNNTDRWIWNWKSEVVSKINWVQCTLKGIILKQIQENNMRDRIKLILAPKLTTAYQQAGAGNDLTTPPLLNSNQ